MKVLLTGANGQLGHALRDEKLFDFSKLGIQLIPCTRVELDLADSAACKEIVSFHKPDWVINAGAYTAVDRAEKEPELAHSVNAGAPAAFAEALAAFGGRLLQLSTDFVFNGNQDSPYLVDHPVEPLGVYGASKAAGEIAALNLPGATVLRTSWVYGPVGNNFLLTMLRLHAVKATAGEALGVVSDQLGCPTSTSSLAAACWRAICLESDAKTCRKLHWSDAGVASWYDFAVAIGDLAVEEGLLERAAKVCPLNTADYVTLAQRPSYSLLNCVSTRNALHLGQVHWRVALLQVIQKLKQARP